MTGWARVRWTEAGQVLALMEAGAGERPDAEPHAYFGELRRTGRRPDAARFLAHALPRLEAVAWSARAVRDLGEDREAAERDARALRSALLWVQDPGEGRRWAAFQAARGADNARPERLAAMAVFFSGGSLSPEGNPPAPPGRTVCARFAASAVLLAAGLSSDRHAALDRALDLGDSIARHGLRQAP